MTKPWLLDLGFFDAMKQRTGLHVEVVRWHEIPSSKLPHILAVIGDAIPETVGVCNLLKDLRGIVVTAEAEGCSVGFMLD